MKRRDFLLASVGTLGAPATAICRAQGEPCPAPSLTLSGASAGVKSISTPCQIPGSASPAWLKGIPPFQWVTLPSLSASNVLPNPPAPGITGTRSVTDAWGGAALRKNGSYYILHGGGHGDYAGNEIYALQLSLDSPQWTRIWGPTPNAEITQATPYYADGNPAAIHTYYFLNFNDAADVFMRFARGSYVTPSGMTRGIDGCRWGAAAWEQNQNNTIWPLPPSEWKFPHGQCQDPTGNVYLINSWNRFLWNRQANIWSTPIANSRYAVQSSGCCFDSRRNTIWSFGGSYGGASVGASQAYMWDVAHNSEALLTLTGPDANVIDGLNANGSSAIYDPVADLIFVVTGDGYAYTFNPSTHIVTRATTTGGSLPKTSPTSALSPWSKLQYVPQLGGVVIQPTWSSPTFFMRTH